ncbi:hypothetical protein SE17_18640 [Kouleothrix aurantiaca]|uniref:Uncharacterized protein n=1 Tax=Kouleothrix aurantiaca TaxID=186479 RepID=A0A0P9DP99_9CHLR|nr:hypothetical protein SE17_18640 [Kouleothrix aurantiaca]
MTPALIALPSPELAIPGFAELPEPIQAAIEHLSTPFPIEEVKVRPGAVRRDGTAALCLAYSDWWTGYLPRLNDEIGPNNWSIILRPWGEHQIIARLRAFGGLIEKESSGSAKGEANGAQEAEAQAKKRACAEGLMLGLYYYFLPNVWGKGERVGKEFVFAEGEEQRCVYEMYARAGLIARSSPSELIPRAGRTARGEASRPPAITPTPSAAPESAPATARAATARRSLEQAERRVGLRQPSTETPPPDSDLPVSTRSTLASDAQLGLITRLITHLRNSEDATSKETAAALDALGARFGIASMSSLRSTADVRRVASRLTKRHAMQLIDHLNGLTPTGQAQAA